MTGSKVHGKENDSSFLYFAKAWQFWMSCFYLYTSMAIAPALDAHTDNIFLRYCSLFIIKIHYQNTVKEPYNKYHCSVVQYVAFSVTTMLICEGWWSMRVKHKAYFINNNILASRYVANMKTFGFVPNERGRHQFHLKLISFWIYIYIA